MIGIAIWPKQCGSLCWLLKENEMAILKVSWKSLSVCFQILTHVYGLVDYSSKQNRCNNLWNSRKSVLTWPHPTSSPEISTVEHLSPFHVKVIDFFFRPESFRRNIVDSLVTNKKYSEKVGSFFPNNNYHVTW